MQTVITEGQNQHTNFEDILSRIKKACLSLDDVDAHQIYQKTLEGIHVGSSQESINELAIQNAVMLMALEPNYSKVAARMLAESVCDEVGPTLSFGDYIKNGFKLGLLSETVLQLAESDLEAIEYSIRHERDKLFEYFGLKTLADRYLLRDPISRKIIERPQWLFMRVALGLSHSVLEALEFYEIMSLFYYIPATPTLFNSGTQHPQMSSCYLLTVAEDSLDGIYKSITDCAKLSKFSGGIGIDWTPIRATGSLIRGTNGLSNGIIPFLKVFDSSVHAVNQGGKRKGAAAIYLSPWHADIESFLELKNNTGSEERRTHNLNLALWIPDLFMKRVEKDQMWSLFSPDQAKELCSSFGDIFEEHYLRLERESKYIRRVSARALYAKMMQTLAETGNGWICFKDKANLRCAQTANSLNVVHSSNLCTEILEVTSSDQTAVCNLGSLNLSTFVKEDQTFDFERLKKIVLIAVKFLDKVIDINFYPTQEAKKSNQFWRPIGLGLMGLQDVFFKLKIPFTSPEAKKLSAKISETIYYYAIQASTELAQKSSSFPGFKDSRYAEGHLQVQLAKNLQVLTPDLNYDWEALALEVKSKGLRNSLLIAIAPTATIASILGCYESIEPQIANIFKRETLSGEFLQINRYLIRELKKLGLWTDEVRSKIIEREGSIQSIDAIPASVKDLYKTTWEISQKDLIDMAIERSTFICQSQSLNLFIEDPSIGKLSSMYMYAWKQGIKTTYYLRSRAKTSIQKTTVSYQKAAVSCSLENPETCQSCQ